MWEQILALVAQVLAPRALNGIITNSGEINLATSGTAVRVIIQPWMRGRYFEFTTVTAACDILFGDSTVDVSYNALTTVAAEAMTIIATTGRHIPADQTRGMVIPIDSDVTHMAFEASGAGFLYIGVSSPKLPTR